MRNLPLRFVALATVLIAINLVGIFWIRAALAPPESALWIDATTPSAASGSSPSGSGAGPDDAERISFIFCRDAVPELQVGEPLAVAPFEVTPAVEGTWVWGTERRLDFQLAKRLAPGRTFRFEMRTALDDSVTLPLVGRREFEFETRRLEVTGFGLRRVEGESAIAHLRFNQPVAPDALRKSLTVEDLAGVAVPFEVEASEPQAIFSLRVPIDGRQVLRARIPAGLTGFDASRGLDRPYLGTLALPRALGVDDVSARAPRLRAQAKIVVSLDRVLDTRQSLGGIVVTPAAHFSPTVYYDDIVLWGDFTGGQRYTVTLPAGIRADDGTVLTEPVTRSIEIPPRKPEIAFPHARGQLSPSGHRALRFDSSRVESVQFSAWRVHPNNIVSHLRGNKPVATSRALADHRWLADDASEEQRSDHLDLRQLLGEEVGVYRLRARAEGHRWIRDEALVTVSDLGLTVRRSENEWCVWVTSVDRGSPRADVDLELRSLNNQVLARARTGADGVAQISVDRDHPDGKPFVLIASQGGDLNYLPAARTTPVEDHVDTSGSAWPGPYDVLLYTERGIYRPGDTVYATALIRTDDGRVPPSFPLELRAVRPDGRETARLVRTPESGGQGFAHFEIPTASGDMTGTYRLSVHIPGSEATLGEAVAVVEPFVPPRFEVKVRGESRFASDERPEAKVSARYLFGPPAEGLGVTATVLLRPKAFHSAVFPEFTFDPAQRSSAKEFRIAAAHLDASGEAQLSFERPKDLPSGLWTASISASVSERGGRTVSGFTECEVAHGTHLLGLAFPETWRVGGQHEIEVLVTTFEDTPARSDALQLRIERVLRGWRYEQVDGRLVWKKWIDHQELTAEKLPTAEGLGSFEASVALPGEYRVIVRDTESGASTVRTFFATVDGRPSDLATVEAPERVELRVEPATAQPGESVRLLVTSPFAGELFLTLEGRNVREYRVGTLESDHAAFDWTVPADLRGTAYFSATVVRGVSRDRESAASDWTPHRARGLARVDLEVDARQQLAVEIEAPEASPPGATMTVVAKVPEGVGDEAAWVHLWAIDEGLRLATDFDAPDPTDRFFAPRSSLFRRLETYHELLPDLVEPTSLRFVGGDRARAERLRRRAAPAPRRDPGVVWRTARRVPAGGALEVQLEAPERSGTLRFFAVAARGDAYGRATATSLLTAPLLVEASLPRAVTPDDRFEFRAKLFNQTDAPRTAQLTLRWDGLAELDDAAESILPPRTSDAPWRVEVPAGGAIEVAVPVRATRLGTVSGALSATCEAIGKHPALAASNDADTWSRAVETVAHEARIERWEAGTSRTLTLARDYVDDSVKSRLRISATPVVELIPALRKVIDYPHGCAEQTTSRFLPLITLDALLREGVVTEAEAGFTRAGIADRIVAGVDRLSALQAGSGGLSYWGRGEASAWITAYAALALVEAQRLEHSVPDRLLVGMLDFLEQHVARGNVEPNLDAFVLRVLSAADRPIESRARRLFERRSELDLAGVAHLVRCSLDLGESGRAMALLDPKLLALEVPLTARGRLTSGTTQAALLLESVLTLDPEHAWVATLTERLVEARRGGSWGNTLSSAVAFRALAAVHRRAQENPDYRGRVQVDGTWHAFDSTAPLILEGDATSWRIETEGEGKPSITVEAEGLTSDPLPAHDRGLRVERVWLDHRGEPLDPAEITSGQLVQVEVELTIPKRVSGRDYGNIAIVDVLPGGFEVESPRLATTPAHSTFELDAADHMEFLDDRVVIFTDADQSRRFRFTYRAVTPGHYRAPGIQASSMYDPALSSVGVSAEVQVKR